jgi:carbonic anhydrase
MPYTRDSLKSRRSVLRLFGAGAVAVCPLCLAGLAHSVGAATPGAPHGATPHWSYSGEGGPEHWGQLSADFKVCDLGLEQTPIDLRSAIKADAGALDFGYRQMPLRVVNNGHTIQVNCDAGSSARINGKAFQLLQFHFHHPSEHLLAGKAFDLECHFVHRDEAGNLAVVGVFLKPGATNAALEPIWRAMPDKEGPERAAGTAIEPAALLPRAREYFRYAGSLTTPPCSEGVLWTVFRESIEASPEQIRQFAALFPANARPVKPLNRRFLLESR